MTLEQSVKSAWKILQSVVTTLPMWEDATEEQRKLATAFYATGFYDAGGHAKNCRVTAGSVNFEPDWKMKKPY